MSDNTQTQTAGNGAAQASAKPKRRIANVSFDGNIGQIKFSPDYGNAVVEIDPKAIHPDIAQTVLAYGAAQIVQTAYNVADDPVAAAQGMLGRLARGDWQPGLTRQPAETDILTAALAAHLGKSPEHVETSFLPAYMAKHGLEAGPAKRRLRAHPAIAAQIASITAERAKKAAAALRKAPAEVLDV